jgi:uncharacterized damage-inducible protein DinB
MTHQDLSTLLDFHYWARDRMLDAADALTPEQYTRDMGNSFRSVRDTVVHIYAAEWIWHQRWRGQSPKALLSADEFPDCASLRQVWVEHEPLVRSFLDGMAGDLDRVMHYTLLNGTPSATPFSHLLQHVVNHASYHRGQVATMLRQLGAGPIKSTDMVLFHRERMPSA